MKVDRLVPEVVGKILFKLSSLINVPKTSGCYVLTAFDGSILYIGLAVNLNRRFKEHLDNSEKTNPTDEGKAVWFYFTNYDSNNLPKLERTWINQYLAEKGKMPVLNKINSPLD